MDDVKKKDKILYIILIIAFTIGAVAIANVHEHWSDEAQSFLLARDNSLKEIFYYAKFEGTSPLWFIIIKFFITLGGNYDTYYILPIFFTTIGLSIFYFKVKAPKIIKILLPFTYFIFYQYTIVARSYCLIFPCLMAICSIYDKRKEKKIIYSLLSFALMNICSYAFVIACSFYLIDIIELISELRKNGLNIKKNKKRYVTLFTYSLELLISLIMLIPSKYCSFNGNGGKSFFYIIYHATIGSKNNLNVMMIIPIIFIGIIIYAIIKEKTKSKIPIIINSVILLGPLILENMVITCQMWHIGIVTIMIFVIFILNDMINTNYIIKCMLTIICIVQIAWMFSSACYDIKNNYSGSEDVANFLKENDYKNKNIYGFGFDITAILPYFENNIFKNQNSEKSFWFWSKTNGYIQYADLLQEEADIYVISRFEVWKYRNLIKSLEEKNYKKYCFEGNIYTKTYIYEDKGYIVLQKE